jgi:GT2 family glycosyltransferase
MNNMVSRPKVLIGITTHNRCDILPKSLASAYTQNYVNKKVLVIDDASTDRTFEMRESYPEVDWIRNELPCGYRENRNQMMQVAGVDYYVSLDDDAWFLQADEIAIAVARMEADPKIGAIAFDILTPTEADEKARDLPKEVFNFIGCGHLLRISAVREAGWYEDSPGPYGGEERDLCIRLMDLGYRIELLPGVHVWHDKAWTGRDWYPLHKSGVCNDLVMATRRCSFPEVLGVVPYKMLSHLRFGLKRREMLRPALAGILQFIKYLSPTWLARKPVKRSIFRQAIGRKNRN